MSDPSDSLRHFALILNDETLGASTGGFKRIMDIIMAYPQLAQRKVFLDANNELCFPLEALATKRFGTTTEEHMRLLKRVYEAFPKAVWWRGADGHNSLHTACNNGQRDVAVFLLDVFPRAASVQDNAGAWPSLYNFFDDSSVYLQTVSKMVGAFMKHGKRNSDPAKRRDDYGLPNLDFSSPILLSLGMKNRRATLVRQMLLKKPSDTQLDLTGGNGNDWVQGSIDATVGKLLAKRVSPWILQLCLDTGIAFTTKGLFAFLSSLAKAKPKLLRHVDVTISLHGEFEAHSKSILAGLTKLLRQLPKLETIEISLDHGSGEPAHSELALNAIAEGLGEDRRIKNLTIHIACPRLAGIDTILSTCRNLLSIDLDIRNCTQEGVITLAKGIRRSVSLQQLHVSFDDLSITSDTNVVIEAVAASSSIKHLFFIVSSAIGDELVFPALTQLSQLKTLLFDGRLTRLLSRSGSSAIFDLLEGPNNLEGLSMLCHSTNRLCEILKRNTILRRLHAVFYGCHRDAKKMVGGIVEALRDSNSTLIHVGLERLRENGVTLASLRAQERAQLDYYLKLNSVGRARVMRAETSTITDVVEVLEGVLDNDESHDEAKSLSLCYGLLRESPQLWSSEYTAGAALVEEEVAVDAGEASDDARESDDPNDLV
jgi:hypothetical protein